MMDELNNDPGKKMRVLLAGSKTSPLARLPKKANVPKTEKKAGIFSRSRGKSQPKDILSDETPPSAPRPVLPALRGIDLNFGPPFWTIASVLSLTVNLVLIVILILVWLSVPSLKFGSLLQMGNNLLGGLYTNFEKMDRAHITRTIPVDSTIPVKFDLQLNQQTSVVLSQSVTIDNALVTVKTGGLNITNALTTIVLPQGTILPIVLNLTVPVDTTVPVKLNVEVDIPLKETQLHDPFKGLGEVVQPFYCMINPAALNMDGQSVCTK
jgi:hypothetical protein